MLTKNEKLEITQDQMKTYGYKVVDAIVTHFNTQNTKKPIALASRAEMDSLFLEEAPENPADLYKVLDFVLENVMTQSAVVSHPKSFSFVPGPSNYISAMADTLATGFNVFSGGWAASPAAAELEIVTIGWLLKIFGFPQTRGGGRLFNGVFSTRIVCGRLVPGVPGTTAHSCAVRVALRMLFCHAAYNYPDLDLRTCLMTSPASVCGAAGVASLPPHCASPSAFHSEAFQSSHATTAAYMYMCA